MIYGTATSVADATWTKMTSAPSAEQPGQLIPIHRTPRSAIHTVVQAHRPPALGLALTVGLPTQSSLPTGAQNVKRSVEGDSSCTVGGLSYVHLTLLFWFLLVRKDTHGSCLCSIFLWVR